MMIAKASRRALVAIYRAPGCLGLARLLHSRAVAIVMYHGITASRPAVPNWCQLEAAEFERQVEFLSREYRILPLREIADRLRARAPLPRRAACLTFDDGFRNVLTTAYPVLARYQAPATVFLVTGAIGTRQPAWPDILSRGLALSRLGEVDFEGHVFPLTTAQQRSGAATAIAARMKRMENDRREGRFEELMRQVAPTAVTEDEPQAALDWAEIEALRRSGLVDFGSHTHTHPILSRCDFARQEWELRTSRNVLVERLGVADLFAYPNGTLDDYTADTIALLEDLGYRCAVSTRAGLNRPGQDLFQLRRVPVGHDTTGVDFRIRMLGM